MVEESREYCSNLFYEKLLNSNNMTLYDICIGTHNISGFLFSVLRLLNVAIVNSN